MAIRIIRTYEAPTPEPLLHLKRKRHFMGSQTQEFVNDTNKHIKIVGVDIPTSCNLCKTEGKVVNTTEEGYHFRCLECGYKW